MRLGASILAGCAVLCAIDRAVIYEALAYGFTVAAVYVALGYLRREEAE